MSVSLKRPVVVAGLPFQQVHFGPGGAAQGPIPVVPNPHVNVSGVEVLKVLVERHKVLQGEEPRGNNEGGGAEKRSGGERMEEFQK